MEWIQLVIADWCVGYPKSCLCLRSTATQQSGKSKKFFAPPNTEAGFYLVFRLKQYLLQDSHSALSPHEVKASSVSIKSGVHRLIQSS